jgi:hypothetical protein
MKHQRSKQMSTPLIKILNSLNAELFTSKSSYPKTDAQLNLQGRTHYVDDDTLRYHRSRVLGRGTLADGALFYIITSDSLDFNHTKRGFRFVVFDVWGVVVGRDTLEDAHRTSDKARKALWAWYGAFDVYAYYERRIRERADKIKNEHETINNAVLDIAAINYSRRENCAA